MTKYKIRIPERVLVDLYPVELSMLEDYFCKVPNKTVKDLNTRDLVVFTNDLVMAAAVTNLVQFDFQHWYRTAVYE